MIKHFTTPEFADLLKQHGIEIETPFYVDDTEVYFKNSRENEFISIIDGDRYSSMGLKPAYLLSEVLGWLPEKLEILNALHFRQLNYHNGQITVGYIRHGYYTISGSIEKVASELLTEGWLTKEIIEQQIKQNQ